MAIKAIDGDGDLYHRLVTDATIPMKGRMIHGTDGSLESQIYSSKGEVGCVLCLSLLLTQTTQVYQRNRQTEAQQRTHRRS